MSRNSRSPSTPAVELGLQLKAERERPRSRHPKGFAKNEIPSDITSSRTLLEVEEGRKKRVSGGLVRELCALYGTDPGLIENLVKLAKATLADDWTDAYGSVVDKDDWLYLTREDRAARLVFHDSMSIPSIIHPRSYVEMIARTTKINYDQPDIDWDQAIRFREDRQRRWLKSQRPTTCLIGEMAFVVNHGEEVNQDLRNKVLDLAKLPFVDIRVIPFDVGRYDLMGWEVSFLKFADGEEPIIRTKTVKGGGFVPVDSHKGQFFRQGLDHASEISISAKEYLS